MDATWVLAGASVVVVGGFVIFRRLGQVTGVEAKRLVAAGATLLDVRTAAEFSEAHLPSAVNIPVSELPLRLGELGNQATPIVVYCASGTRSAVARSMLKGKGFISVHTLGSMGSWGGGTA